MIKSLIITIIILMILGVLSLQKPDIVGVDFYWAKYKWFYIPKSNKSYRYRINNVSSSIISIYADLCYLSTYKSIVQ